MALSKKARFQLDVLEEYGVMPLFDGGKVPDFVADPESPSERFGPWCRRVLERDAIKVTLLAEDDPDPKASIRKLAATRVDAALRSILTEHRKLGKEAAEKSLGAELESALSENTMLKEKFRTVTARNNYLENAAQIRKARSDVAKREVVAAALQEFLEEERDHLGNI